MPVGSRIYLKKNETGRKFLEEFAKIPCANIADTMGRLCAMHPRIKLMSNPNTPITAGVALTVKSRGGDNLLIHAALDMAGEGDVMIISNEGGEEYRSLMGEIMFTHAMYRKITGIVMDGAIRDVDAVRQMPMPIYATGSNPGGPYKEGPGEINVPISCGGVSINPGDIVVMDADGVIVIPLEDAAEVLEAAKKLSANDAAKVKAAAEGKAKRAWVAEKIAAKDIQIIDDSYYKF